MGQAVQFFGIKSVLSAFANMNCSAWSILQGQQFQFKYEGDNQEQSAALLEQLLESIQESGDSKAIYTLRVYEEDTLKRDTAGKAKIYSNTPYDGSFNFRLVTMDQYEDRKEGGKFRDMDLRLQKMETLLTDFIERKNEEEPEPEISPVMGMVKGILDMPEIKSAIAGKVVALVSGFLSPAPARIAGPYPLDPGAPAVPQAAPASSQGANVQRLNDALVILYGIDPELPDNLWRLAQIAKKDPAQYKGLVSMLKNLDNGKN